MSQLHLTLKPKASMVFADPARFVIATCGRRFAKSYLYLASAKARKVALEKPLDKVRLKSKPQLTAEIYQERNRALIKQDSQPSNGRLNELKWRGPLLHGRESGQHRRPTEALP